MKVVLLDTGRGRRGDKVVDWRHHLRLHPDDELALISWFPPAEPLPVVDQLVFGPTFAWGRREPSKAVVSGERRTPAPALPPASTKDLSITDPRRLKAAVAWRRRRLGRAIDRRLTRLAPEGRSHPFDVVSSSSPFMVRTRERLGRRSDGIATDFAIAVARSASAAELVSWADLIVPFDIRSRKAAWTLARRVPGPAAHVDITSAARVVDAHHLTHPTP